MIYFISDVHLGHHERDKNHIVEKRLIAVLRKISGDCEKLFIVGDLFDHWFEYKTVIPREFIRTLSELLSMRERGIDIEYMIGNHDFGHIDFFEKELNIPTYQDDIERELYGKKFYISHGDGKMSGDTGYKIIKKILRNPVSQKLYRILHPDFGIGIASSSSRKSRTYTDKKDYGKSDGMAEFAENIINRGFDYVVMGHRHKAKIVDVAGGKYVNLGEMFRKPTFGAFDGKEFRIINADEFVVGEI